MRRRDFIKGIAGSAACWPLAAHGQLSAVPLIAFLSGGSLNTEGDRVKLFRETLKEAGFVEGQHLTIDYRFAEGQFEKLPALASELIRRDPAVIVASNGTSAVLAAKAASRSIPIVFSTGGDPIKSGLVGSLNHPGGNVTGLSLFTAALESKRIELLHEILPDAAIIGFLVNPNTMDSDPAAQVNDANNAARKLGKSLIVLNTYTEQDFETAFLTLARSGARAFFYGSDSIFFIRRAQLIRLAAGHGLAAVYATREFVTLGGLMSYGDNILESYRQLAHYVVQILNGAKPGDLPIVQPTKFELVINVNTAKALRLRLPPTLLARADEVIE